MEDIEDKEIKEEFLSAQDFASIKELRTKQAFVANSAEKAILESKVADLEYKSFILNVYLKYKLSMSDSIDENTGKILHKEIKE
jgi:hypothetical protein